MRDEHPDTDPAQFKQDKFEKPEMFAQDLSPNAKKAAQARGLELHHIDGFYFALGWDAMAAQWENVASLLSEIRALMPDWTMRDLKLRIDALLEASAASNLNTQDANTAENKTQN